MLFLNVSEDHQQTLGGTGMKLGHYMSSNTNHGVWSGEADLSFPGCYAQVAEVVGFSF